MKKYIVFLLTLFVIISLFIYGCGSKGGSSMETSGNSQMSTSVMDGVSLINSKQGQSGGFVDFDGDGIDDKLVGAPYAETPSGLGAVLVYKGDSNGGFSSSPEQLLTGDDNFGYSFANIGDVDGDGKDDFAAGAISGDGDDVSLCGSVYVYKGGGNGQIIKKLSGEGPMDKFGLSVTSGDLNHDGNTDIIVGAPFNTNDASLYQGGAVYVYLGPDFSNKVSIYASSSYKGLGWAADSGDVNGDGIDDLVVSATSSKKGLVYYGSAGSFAPSVDSPDLKISGSDSSFGLAIAVIGDIDGSSGAEMVFGAPKATINDTSNVGSVYIIQGGTTTTLVQMDGTNLFDRFGASVASVPDMDGDGKAELAVGATTANSDPDYLSGKVYLFKSGNLNLTDGSWTSPSAFYGTTKDQSYGTFLAPTNNGKLLIGAPRSNMDTGGVSLVDLATGEIVAEGSSGGGGGDSGDCH